MKYPFKRDDERNLDAWEKTNQKLMATMCAAVNEIFEEAELEDFFRRAVRDAKPLPKNPEMMFWGYDEPETMPSDGRCEFFYLPTYLMVLTMVAGINSYPQLLELDSVRDVLTRGLYGCTGRGLVGHGFDGTATLFDNLMMFTKAGIQKFLHDHPDIGGKFGELYEEQIAKVREDYKNDNHVFDWNYDFSEEQRKLLWLYDSISRDLLTNQNEEVAQ